MTTTASGVPVAPHLPTLDVDETAIYLGVSPRTVRRLAAKGAIASHRVGGTLLRFSAADVDEYVQRVRRRAVI
jgi:excisionase family DNA binding protein